MPMFEEMHERVVYTRPLRPPPAVASAPPRHRHVLHTLATRRQEPMPACSQCDTKWQQMSGSFRQASRLKVRGVVVR